MKKLKRRPLYVALALAGLVAVIVGGFYIAVIVWDKKTQSSRLVDTIHRHVIYPDIFTENNVIDSKEEYIGFQGDGTLEGNFSINASEMQRLLKAPEPLQCGSAIDCKIERSGNSSNELCYGGRSTKEEIDFTLCLSASKNEAYWQYSWY